MTEIVLSLHKCITNEYIGEINIPKNLELPNVKNIDHEFIIIFDESGSMGNNVHKMLSEVFPSVLEKLEFPATKNIHLISFESHTNLTEMKISDLKKSNEHCKGSTNMSRVYEYVEKVFSKNPNQKYYRILTVSDGEIWDQQETLKNASVFAEKIKGKYVINSQAIRLFTSSSQPDTTGLCSALQLNNIGDANLIDISSSLPSEEIANRIFELFNNDGLNKSLFISSNSQKFKESPWGEELNKSLLSYGKNILFFEVFELDKKENEFKLCLNDNKPIDNINIKVEVSNEINYENYHKILGEKIKTFMNKIKILKIINTSEAKLEMEKIISSFQKFESSNFTKPEFLEEIKVDNTLSSRIQYIKTLIKKNSTMIFQQMRQIQNDENINSLNSLQKAEFLRQMDVTKNSKSLAKRAINLSTNYDVEIHNDIKKIAEHFDELKDIKKDNLNVSFYSTISTLEGLEELVKLSKDDLFEQIPGTDMLKLINIVGIAVYGKIGDYPEPSLYKPNKIFPGCYISLSDILTVNEYTNNKENLKPPGNNTDEINNCIPIFEDDKIHHFLINYAPSILEYMASIGMRRLLLEVPYTYENTIIAGIWIMINQLCKNQSEIYCKNFKDIINSMNVVVKDHFLNIIDIIKNNEIKKTNPDNAMFLNNYNLYNLLYPLYVLSKGENEIDETIVQKMLRSMYQNEIYNSIRIMVKKNTTDNKENKDQKKFIEDTIFELLSINFEKYTTQTDVIKKKIEFKIDNIEFEVNKKKLKDMCKSIYYLDRVSLIYTLFKLSSLDNFQDELKKLKFDDELYKQKFGIDYDMESFRLFNICQALFYFDKSFRQNDIEETMKIIDLKDYNKCMEQLQKDVNHLCAKEFHKRYKIYKKKQIEKLSDELSDKLVNCDNIEEFNNLMLNGITMDNFTYKIEKETTLGFYKLKKKLLDPTKNHPLKLDKILYILDEKKEDDKVKWNNGNPLRNNLKDFVIFIEKYKKQTSDENTLNKIKDILLNIKLKNYCYRDKPNRHGHSNAKKSYWAFGYKSLNEMKEKDENLYETYKNLHKDCCGLESQNNVKSIYQIKKEEHKKERKYWKEKMKGTKKKEENNNEEKKRNPLGLKSRGRFGRGRFRRGRK